MLSKKQIALKNNAKKIKEAQGQKKESTPEQRAKEAADREAYKCLVCLQVFPVTIKADALVQHAASKHAKLNISQCFPKLPDK
jgi:hypothetical protein